MDRLTHNEAHFDHDVEKGAGSTVPCLDLDADTVRAFARGELDRVPESLAARGRFPGIDLAHVDGKDILLLGSGGGQQSAVLGLLGARVTVLELSSRQLDGDRAAAAHYGYDVKTIHGDMQMPEGLPDASCDAIFAPCTMYVPDIRLLLAECHRLLRIGGVLSMGLLQPVRQARFLAGLVEGDVYDPRRHAIEYIHYMDDIFSGLVDAGLSLVRVTDEGRSDAARALPPGSLDPAYVDEGGFFFVVSTKTSGA